MKPSPPKKKKRRLSITRQFVLLSFILLILASGAVYLKGREFFQTHMKAGTEINGFRCSFKTVDEVSDLLQREGKSYALAVYTRNGGVEEISAEDAGVEFVGQDQVAQILADQDRMLWFFPENESVTLPRDCYRTNTDMLMKSISELKCMNSIVKGKTAKIVNTKGTYQVSPGLIGTNLDTAKASAVIETAFHRREESIDLEENGCYIDVEYADEEELQKQCDFLNSIRDLIITYDFGDRKETVTMDTIEKCMLDENYQLTRDLVVKYVRSFANKYNTVGSERDFYTFNGTSVTFSGGDYGWKIDVKKTADSLLKLISEKAVEVVKPIYTQTAVSRKTNDIGYSYLEINASTGDAVLYIDGSPTVQAVALVGSDVPSGFWNIKEASEISTDGRRDILAFGDSFCVCNTVSGMSQPNMVMIADQAAMSGIYAMMNKTWPIIIYRS